MEQKDAVADLGDGRIVVRGKQTDLLSVSRIPGAKLTEQHGGISVYTMPATLDTCFALKGNGIGMTPAMREFGNRANRVQKYIEAVKMAKGPVEPLQPVPIKAPYKLYQHQVKAYNIALALFGRGARKEDA